MREPDAAGARQAAQTLLNKHGVKSFPVPVERIAKALGVRVEYAPLDGELSGLAHIHNGVPIVGINTLHAPNRQRFTLAHELAHIQLHRQELEAQCMLIADRSAATPSLRQVLIRPRLRPMPLRPSY